MPEWVRIWLALMLLASGFSAGWCLAMHAAAIRAMIHGEEEEHAAGDERGEDSGQGAVRGDL